MSPMLHALDNLLLFSVSDLTAYSGKWENHLNSLHYRYNISTQHQKQKQSRMSSTRKNPIHLILPGSWVNVICISWIFHTGDGHMYPTGYINYYPQIKSPMVLCQWWYSANDCARHFSNQCDTSGESGSLKLTSQTFTTTCQIHGCLY